MDSTRTLAATTTSSAVPSTPSLRATAEANADASDVFSNLLQTVGSRFAMTASNLVDPTIIHNAPAPVENRAPDSRDDQSAQSKDKSVDNSGGKKNSTSDDKTASAQDAASARSNAASDAANASDTALATQLAAVQALLLSQQVTAPVATGPATTTVLPTAAPVDPTTPVTNATPVIDPTTPVATTAAPTTTATAQPVATVSPQQLLAAQVQATATVTQTPTTTTTAAAPTTQVATPKTDPLAGQAQTDTPDVTATPTQTDTATPRSAAAQAQSQSLSRLLGDTNAIRVAVTVTPQAQATPTLSTYDHFNGYTMADNAAGSIANGQFGNAAPTNALVTTPDAPVTQPTVAAQAILAAAQSPTPATAQTATPTTIARPEAVSASAVTSVASASESAGADSGLGQMGLGQSGLSGNQATNATSNAAATTQSQPTTPAQVFEQIKVKITRATKAGLDQVSIQLKPEALGRVDIKLEVSPDGKVHATVTADKQDTLNLLQNDAHGLEQALNDAGLRADADSLQFNLRGDGNAQTASDNGTAANGTGVAANDDTASDVTYDYTQAALQRGGVDTYA